MSHDAPVSRCYTFGGLTPEEILRFFRETLYPPDSIRLSTGKSAFSFSFFGLVIFRMRPGKTMPCLEIAKSMCEGYLGRISGAFCKGSTAYIPLETDASSAQVARKMVSEIHIASFSRQTFQRPDVLAKSSPRYAVIDAEMPNNANDTMCSLGVVLIENEQITASHYFLIDPQAPFDEWNMALHGITPEAVAGKPTFAQLWPVLEPLLCDRLLVAHGAPSDMAVLAKCINAAQIPWRPWVSYLCTCEMARACLPDAESFKLNMLCRQLGIDLQHHHNALSDADACAKLFLHCLKQCESPFRFVRHFDIPRARTIHTRVREWQA